MNKENILFGIVGLLGGLIIGFMFANSMNRNMAVAAAPPASTMAQNANMPPGHPDIGSQTQTVPPNVQQDIDQARKSPQDFDAQFKAAGALYKAEIYEQALEFLLAANKLKPDDYDTIVSLGNVSFDSGKFEDAEKWYTNALGRKKDDLNVRTDLGLTFIFREKPDYERAIQEFNLVLSADPNHIQALQNSIVAYLRKGDTSKAKENLARLEAADPKNNAAPRLREQINKAGA
jgi:tetratricopeptide (TPR) repeat protein